jgi:hypothetical protein
MEALLKYLDQIVRYAIRKSRFDRPAHFDLGRNANGFADAVLNANDIKSKEFVRIDVDQHVKVAVFAGIAACSRAEYRKLCYAAGLECRGSFFKLGDDLVAGHGTFIAQNRIAQERRHVSPVYRRRASCADGAGSARAGDAGLDGAGRRAAERASRVIARLIPTPLRR